MTFAIASTLKQHNDSVHKCLRPFKCTECPLAFAISSTLKQHNDAVHLRLKPHPCNECIAAFATATGLKQHKDATHLCLKPYACTKCDAVFASAGNLKGHNDAVHLGLRPYACNECDAAFAVASNLKAHKQQMHTELGRQRQKKKEQSMANFLDKSGIKYDRELSISFCNQGNKKTARIDFVIYKPWGVVLLELDEEQHKHYPIICEVARMIDIIGQQILSGREDKFKIIRFNPDAFKMACKTTKVQQQERRARLLECMTEAPQRQFEIQYMFYDQCGRFPDICNSPEYPDSLKELVAA
jgi:hypothetical protein